MSILMGENSTRNVSVAEENFFTLDSQDQDDDARTSIKSVEAYLDTSMHSPNLDTTLNGNFPVTSVFCCESFPPCKRCQAHLDAITFLMHMEGGVPNKISNDTEIPKFDFGHSPVCPSAFMNLASEPDSCLTVDAKEEKCEARRSLVLQNGSVENFCSKSYASQESTKEKYTKATVDPPSTQLLNCTSVDRGTMESGHMFLLDNVPKKNVRRGLKYNGFSECNSTDLLDTSYENRHPEVHLMDSEEKTRCNSHIILDSDDGNFVNNIDQKLCTPALLLQSIDNGYSVTIEKVADDQSGFHIKTSNVNPGRVEDDTMLELGNIQASPIVTWNSISGNTVSMVCEDPSVVHNCHSGFYLQFPDSEMPKTDGQIDLAHGVTMEEHPYSVVDEGTSISMCRELYLNGNGRDSLSGKLRKLVVESTHLDRVSALWHGSQSHIELKTSTSQTHGAQQPSSIKNEDGHTRYIPSTTDGDPHTSEIQNCALTDNIFLGMSPIDSVSEERGLSQFSARCSESSSNDQPTNKHCMQFVDVSQVARDSYIDSGTQFNALVSHSEDEFSVMKEQSMGSCAHMQNLSVCSDSFVGVHDSLIEEVANGPHVVEDILLKNLANEDHESCRSPFEDLKQIPVNNFCMNRVELEHGADSLGEVDASYVDEDTKSHQIAVADDKCCSQSVEKQMLVKEWTKNQTADNQHTITERKEKARLAEPSKICCPCGICHEYGEPCTKVSINCSVKDCVQQTTDCTRDSKVTEDSCLTHNERVSGSFYVGESPIVILNHLDVYYSGTQEQCEEEVCEVEIHKMDLDMPDSACPLTVDFSEEATVGMCHDHLNHTVASISIIRNSEITLASNKVGPSFPSYVGSINLETSSKANTSENTSVHCDNFFSTSDQEFRNSYLQKEECLSCSTACVFEMKNSRDQSIEQNNHPQPPMDEGVNSKHQNDGACVETLTKDVGDGVMSLNIAVQLGENKSKEAAALASKPGRKLPLKSFAGGITLLGALFLLFHFRKRRGTGNVTKSVLKLQNEKASHERCRGQDKGGALYPPERLKF